MTITINLKGRLGNQLFQYATLRNLSIKTGYSFYINTNIEWQGQLNLLNFFNIKESSPSDGIKYNYSQPNNSFFFDSNIYHINDNTILEGHFENIEYFKDNEEVIKNELTIKDESINNYTYDYINNISKNGSKVVGIHFRRGDLIQQINNIDNFNQMCLDFVKQSLKTILEQDRNITLLLFTGGIRKSGSHSNWINHNHDDDLLWIQKFVSDNESNYDIHISPGTTENNELLDFSLLSNCDYIITPYQSTFSFMAYYVNKKVIEYFSPTNLYGLNI